jgi:hypothetical protein
MGRVKLWGDIVEHERGYRAEFAKITAIDACTDGSKLTTLRARYAVAPWSQAALDILGKASRDRQELAFSGPHDARSRDWAALETAIAVGWVLFVRRYKIFDREDETEIYRLTAFGKEALAYWRPPPVS